jgi:hypothetical protein
MWHEMDTKDVQFLLSLYWNMGNFGFIKLRLWPVAKYRVIDFFKVGMQNFVISKLKLLVGPHSVQNFDFGTLAALGSKLQLQL